MAGPRLLLSLHDLLPLDLGATFCSDCIVHHRNGHINQYTDFFRMVVVHVSLIFLWSSLDTTVEPLHLTNTVSEVASSDTGFKWQDLHHYGFVFPSKGFCCMHCSAGGVNLKLRW